ncbi:hypothetical protein BLNAU_7515 [Blattamonas nauphoetae]|uniref:Uncharacterized protein n=1 Tax=Blattamonas nauphoetae TaxID=2049346 RepID=A0ABQ9Y1J7_9EUKA|nr:hypothetical protein BLNAU_7515 [Blattamonas nauphoetae]
MVVSETDEMEDMALKREEETRAREGFHPALDASLEAKAVKLLESVRPRTRSATENYLSNLASHSDDSLTNFVQCVVVLTSSPSQVITTAAMKMLETLIWTSSAEVRLALVNAYLIPQLINTLNPLSLSFTKSVDIHNYLLSCSNWTVWLTTPSGLEDLGTEDGEEQQAVHETILKQIVAPSEEYIRHLCVNRFLIVDRDISYYFLELVVKILRICPYYQQTRDFIIDMPVFLTITSSLTFFENERSIRSFLWDMNYTQREWNKQSLEVRQMGKTVLRMLRMEGIEDVIEEKLRNDLKGDIGGDIVDKSIELNNLQGMNLPGGW